jgi:HlyD family secretion protein
VDISMIGIDGSLLRDAWRLLTPRQRMGAAGCLVVFIAASIVELAGLSSAMPFVLALMDPTHASQNWFVVWVAGLLGNPQFGTLMLYLGAGVALMILGGGLAGFAAMSLIDWYGVRVATFFADRMIREAAAAPYPWFLDQQAPVLAQRFVQDPTTAGMALYAPLMEIIYNCCFLVFAIVVIMATLPVQSMLVLGSLLVTAVFVLRVFRPMTERYAAVQRDLLMDANQIGVELVSGIKDVKVKAREAYFSRIHTSTIYAAAIARMKLILVARAVPALILLVGQLGILAVALALFHSGASAAELTAQLTLLVLVMGRALPAVTRLFGNVNKFQGSRPYVRSLLSMKDEIASIHIQSTPSSLPDVPAGWGEVSFNKVAFSYPRSDGPVLTNVDMTLERNRFYGIVGPSGAGKTTMLDLLLGLLEPKAGAILIDDKPLSGYARRSWFQQIGYVPQNPFIASDTVRRNVAFGMQDERIDDDRVWRALTIAGLADVCRRLPNGLDTQMGDRGIRLSGGQRQRLSIARAFYDEPKLLIFDEATSALDSLTEREIQNSIAELAGKVTIVVVAHRLTTVEMSDCLFVFDGGKVVARGTYQELLASTPLFRQLASHFIGATGGQAVANPVHLVSGAR